ncbi:MAG TPA: hypothetical protein PKC73_11345 [Dermatophilaceae bacterium]|jgi:hypothetical protein|nr:hypothetical protein [Actinomycetales bacterium]HMT31441.1 hypothetical protein [Dermatophilaceae bacterium]HMT90216.1 hypothetical protein [Dermatophilaceae bacterium]
MPSRSAGVKAPTVGAQSQAEGMPFRSVATLLAPLQTWEQGSAAPGGELIDASLPAS